MRLGILFSGGKDSNSVIQYYLNQGWEVKCLISLLPKNPDSWMFQSVNLALTKLQAKAIQIPIIQQTTSGEKEKELTDLKKAIQLAKKKYRVEGIAVGALASDYQHERVNRICEDLSLKTFSPLWHKNQMQLLKQLVDEGFEVVFTQIAAQGLTEEWLGKKIDEKALKELQELEKKFGLQVGGEGGEFESFVLFAPFYKKHIRILSAEKKMENECTGRLIIKRATLERKTKTQ